MTLSTAILWSFVRCICVATLAIVPAAELTAWLRSTGSGKTGSGKSARIGLIAALLPFLVPELLLGYTWRLAAARLVDNQPATELLYGLILTIRAVAITVAVRLMMPASDLSEEALHSWKLLRPVTETGRWRWFRIRLKMNGPWRPILIAWSLAALVSFQEFETAALLQIDRHPIAWTVWLFDAHASRQPISDSLEMILRPVLIEFLLLTPVWVLLRGSTITSISSLECNRSPDSSFCQTAGTSGRTSNWLALAWLFLSLSVCLFWPLATNAAPLLRGIRAISDQWPFLRQSFEQILISLGFAAAATIVALRIAVWLHFRQTPALTMLLLMPGLCGSLMTSISLLSVFQLPVLNGLYDSWLPLLLGLALTLLPRAWLIAGLVLNSTSPLAVYSANLLDESPDAGVRQRSTVIRWKLQASRWFFAGLILSHWGFWDVTIASTLRPIQLEPVVTRLYNEMHYGRTEALTLITLMAAAAVPLSALMAAIFWRLWVTIVRFHA